MSGRSIFIFFPVCFSKVYWRENFKGATINSNKIINQRAIFKVKWDLDVCIRDVFIRDIQRRQWHPTPVLLPGKFHGWRSLVGCSPWGREESDMTERLHFHFSLSCIGEGNGSPLQCSCLENPRDSEA